jgi:hypothetical protein
MGSGKVLFVTGLSAHQMQSSAALYVSGGNLAELLRKQIAASAEIPVNRAT